MSIVSIVTRVPDAEARVRASGGVLDLGDATFVIDGMDEYGVEHALRLREAGYAGDVIALGYGPADTEQVLRTALAMGADRAVLLRGDDLVDPVVVAQALAEAVREADAELVLVGGKQAHWDSAALGPALAEALGWPCLDWTTAFALDGDVFEAVHDVDDGSEAVRGRLPVVVTTQQGLNEPRYPTLPNIMKAKRKPLDVRDADAPPALARPVAFEVAERARRNVVVGGAPNDAAAELVRRLRDEAKVL